MIKGLFGKIFGGTQPSTTDEQTTPVKTTPQRQPGTPFSPAPQTPFPSAPQQKHSPGNIIATGYGALYRSDGQVFQPVFMKVDAHLDKAGTDQLVIVHDGDVYLKQPVSNSMNLRFFSSSSSLIWLTPAPAHAAFSLKFGDNTSLHAFVTMLAKCLWERNNDTPMSKLKEDDVTWVVDSYRGDPPAESADQTSAAEEYEDMMDVEAGHYSQSQSGKNQALAVGYKDRAFVARGNKIGIFKQGEDELEYTASQTLNDIGSSHMSPSKALLEDALYQMDLNRPDVVQEWTLGGDKVREIFPTTKHAQQEAESTVLGLNNAGYFRIDPRLKGDKAVQEDRYMMTGKPLLSCAATTGDGQMVIGSQKGDLRLYSANLGIRAKTALPGLGDPIVGVDVTEDGRWVLATTATYLLVFLTEDQETGTNGFNKPLGAKKPAPMRLQLKYEDMQYIGEPNFTRAYFDHRADGESWIVTSTDKYIIMWNFRKVKKGHLDSYKIIEYNDEIVEKQFRFGQDSSIVVTLPNDVRLASRPRH